MQTYSIGTNSYPYPPRPEDFFSRLLLMARESNPLTIPLTLFDRELSERKRVPLVHWEYDGIDLNREYFPRYPHRIPKGKRRTPSNSTLRMLKILEKHGIITLEIIGGNAVLWFPSLF